MTSFEQPKCMSFYNYFFCQSKIQPNLLSNKQMKRIVILSSAALLVAVASASAFDTKETWEKTCAKCHGADGKGETKMGKKLEIKDLTDAKVQTSLKDEEMFKAIKEGVRKGDTLRMKAIEGLSDEDIKAMVSYVRTLKK